jgi:hypothetical protein
MHVWNFLDQVREEARKQQGQGEVVMPVAAAAKPMPVVTPVAAVGAAADTSDCNGARSKRYDGSSARKGCGGVKGVCAVCMMQPCSVILLPCRHLVLCRGCSGAVEAQGLGCPLCQEVVEKHLVVHRS